MPGWRFDASTVAAPMQDVANEQGVGVERLGAVLVHCSRAALQ
jgi:hypothetical protein